MRNLAMRVLAATAFVALTVSAYATPPVPRKSPEFTITDPSGKQILLSSLRGKIVVMPFMFTTCPHCQRYAQVLTKLQQEFGPRGVVMVGAVFNDANGAMAAQFVKEFNVGFPVGYATREQVLSYLGISIMDGRWVVPQAAIIDKKGNIVAQSAATGSPELQEEASLRAILDKLVKESATSSTGAAAKPAAKTVAKSSTSKSN